MSPFAGFKSFDEGVRITMKKKGWSEKRAKRYVGAIKHKVERYRKVKVPPYTRRRHGTSNRGGTVSGYTRRA